MPRRRADKVIEHRLSLSDGLHKEMKKTLSANKITNQVAMAGNAGKAIMNVAAVGAIGAIAYLGVKAYAEAKGVMPQVKESFQKAWDWGFGVETNADGSIVPTTVTITNAYGNQETVVNPINSIPVLNKTPFVGGLFDWGMKLGAATNPFEDNEAAASFVDDLTGFTWEEQKEYQDYVNPDYVPPPPEEHQAWDFSGMFDMPGSDAAFASSWARAMEAEMREAMGDAWVEQRLAEDPNYFAWKAFEIKDGIGMPEMDFSGLEGMADWQERYAEAYTIWQLNGHSPVAETTPDGVRRSMNSREWRELVAQVRRAGDNAIDIGVDLDWSWPEYRAYWLSLWG